MKTGYLLSGIYHIFLSPTDSVQGHRRKQDRSRILAEILPFDLAELLQRITNLSQVVTIANLYMESLHLVEQLARVPVDRYVDLGPAGGMRRTAKDFPAEPLPLRAS